MQYRVAATLLPLLIATCGPGTLYASEADYIGLFGGPWSGSGIVLNNDKPWQVNCQAVGQPAQNHLLITGTCAVFLVSVAFEADVTFDPATGRYSGTYAGGNSSAQISGQRSGSTVDFTMIWSKPIDAYGDTQANLTIVNSGNGSFSIVIDNHEAAGPTKRASDLLLSQG
jgi:hypothetical protein